jgi:hypothetical protein
MKDIYRPARCGAESDSTVPAPPHPRHSPIRLSSDPHPSHGISPPPPRSRRRRMPHPTRSGRVGCVQPQHSSTIAGEAREAGNSNETEPAISQPGITTNTTTQNPPNSAIQESLTRQVQSRTCPEAPDRSARSNSPDRASEQMGTPDKSGYLARGRPSNRVQQ